VVWWPPVEPSAAEQAVIKAVLRARLFVFLRLHRHELFDERFQAELAEAYVDSPKGQPPVPPAQLALATILQAYTGVSDDEVIEATVMDRRWQLVLDCMGAESRRFQGNPGGVPQAAGRAQPGPAAGRADGGAGRGHEGVRGACAAGGAGLVPAVGRGPGGGHDQLDGTPLRKALGVIAAVQGRGQAAGTAVLAHLVSTVTGNDDVGARSRH
jgi:transposase